MASRNQFDRLVGYFELINQLNQIYRSLIKTNDNYFSHPLLKKTIEENKSLPAFYEFVDYVDWKRKYEMYNEVLKDS